MTNKINRNVKFTVLYCFNSIFIVLKQHTTTSSIDIPPKGGGGWEQKTMHVLHICVSNFVPLLSCKRTNTSWCWKKERNDQKHKNKSKIEEIKTDRKSEKDDSSVIQDPSWRNRNGNQFKSSLQLNVAIMQH